MNKFRPFVLVALILSGAFLAGCSSMKPKIAESTGCAQKELKIISQTDTPVAQVYKVECNGVLYDCSQTPVHFSCSQVQKKQKSK